MTVPVGPTTEERPPLRAHVAAAIGAALDGGSATPEQLADAALDALAHPPQTGWRLMDPAEFKAAGYLSEVNRRVLHPMGLALAAYPELPVVLVYDERHDPEGIYFGGDAYPEVCAQERRFSSEWAKREPARRAALGYMVQETEF